MIIPFNHIKFTRREIEVMTWTARGKTYDDISSILSITEDTVKFHIENARVKLNAVNKTHAIAVAVSRGYIKL